MNNRNFLLTFILIAGIIFKSSGQDKGFVGYATAFIKEDSVVKTNYFGFSDKDKSLKYVSSTIQPIASVSKTFIGISLMIAQEKGLLNLDEDIGKYLDFQFTNANLKKSNTITLRHLATHTSGIVDNEKLYESSYSYGFEPNMKLGVYLKEYLTKNGSKYSKKNFNESIAGTKYEYSNVASALAAYVIEKVSGISFASFTKEYIFESLGMNNTGWFYKDIEISNHAILYDEKDKPLKPYSCATYPDGSLRTTLNDLSIYLLELMKGFNGKSEFLSKESWQELFEQNFKDNVQVKNINQREPNTGIFMVYFKSGNIGHTGSDLGASAFISFSPKTNSGRIFMANEDITEKNLEEFKSIWENIEQ